MNYRPICDTWWLARSKLKPGPNGERISLYGAYPAGFLERARALLGVNIEDPVLHVCGGLVRYYPYKGFGRNDKTLDLNPDVWPDYCQDAREPYPMCPTAPFWGAVLADPPYSPEDADRYEAHGLKGARGVLPSPRKILENSLRVVAPGGRVGILHYVAPRPPREVKFVASVSVLVGYENRVRLFSVYERPFSAS